MPLGNQQTSSVSDIEHSLQPGDQRVWLYIYTYLVRTACPVILRSACHMAVNRPALCQNTEQSMTAILYREHVRLGIYRYMYDVIRQTLLPLPTATTWSDTCTCTWHYKIIKKKLLVGVGCTCTYTFSDCVTESLVVKHYFELLYTLTLSLYNNTMPVEWDARGSTVMCSMPPILRTFAPENALSEFKERTHQAGSYLF